MVYVALEPVVYPEFLIFVNNFITGFYKGFNFFYF